jgi:hypothetical protein
MIFVVAFLIGVRASEMIRAGVRVRVMVRVWVRVKMRVRGITKGARMV